VALHVEVKGEGPAVVLAHGFGGSARNFRPQQRALRESHCVACYDARGHARSPAPEPPGDYTIATLVADFASAAAATGAGRCVAGGLSLGAAIALQFALAHPGRVRALVLASYPAGRGEAGGFSGSAGDFADALEERGLEGAGDEFVWGPRSGLDQGAAKLVRQGFLEHSARGLAAILRNVLATLPSPDELAPQLAAVEVPALIVAGELDPPSLRASERLATAMPNARLEVVPGAGHVVNLAKPAAFNSLLVDFLADLPA
jgi:pimeloyl-ACP methyl ester carboxylesterase